MTGHKINQVTYDKYLKKKPLNLLGIYTEIRKREIINIYS